MSIGAECQKRLQNSEAELKKISNEPANSYKLKKIILRAPSPQKFMEETEKETQVQEGAVETKSPQSSEKTHILKKFPKKGPKGALLLVVGALLVVFAGIGTGWALSGGISGRGGAATGVSGVAPGAEEGVMEAGIADEETFRDSAEGLLEKGGVDGEGTHHLVREGGPSKYVYLTSTVIDLESFVDKTVMVWGETIGAQQAGWLMDVGKIKVIE